MKMFTFLYKKTKASKFALAFFLILLFPNMHIKSCLRILQSYQ